LWLHIGLPKTASSFVQETLKSNAGPLSAQGYLYPRSGRQGAGHRLLAFPFLPENRARQPDVAPHLEAARKAWPALERELTDGPERNLILSSEYFCDVQEIAPVAAACRSIAASTRVVVYLRRQDRFLESGYNQGVKAGLQTGRLGLGPEVPKSLDWYALVSRWARHFGRENVIVRVFEEAVAEGRMIEDFCAAVGLDSGPIVPAERRNARLSNEVLGYRRVENALGLTGSRLAHRVTERMRAVGYPERHILSRKERIRVVEAFEESNRRVAREFLGRSDGRLFDREGLEGPDGVVSDADGVGAALAVAWDELNGELDRLRREVAALRTELQGLRERNGRPWWARWRRRRPR